MLKLKSRDLADCEQKLKATEQELARERQRWEECLGATTVRSAIAKTLADGAAAAERHKRAAQQRAAGKQLTATRLAQRKVAALPSRAWDAEGSGAARRAARWSATAVAHAAALAAAATALAASAAAPGGGAGAPMEAGLPAQASAGAPAATSGVKTDAPVEAEPSVPPSPAAAAASQGSDDDGAEFHEAKEAPSPAAERGRPALPAQQQQGGGPARPRTRSLSRPPSRTRSLSRSSGRK
jgi:hypothetical protein